MFYNAASPNGTIFWFAGSGTGTGPGGYGVGNIGFGLNQAATSGVFANIGPRFVDINPFNNALFASGQMEVVTSGTAATVYTDIYTPVLGGTPEVDDGVTTGYPVWTNLGLNHTLHAPRGFSFVNATTLFVCDNGYGLRRALLQPNNSWTPDPVTYVAHTTDANYTQVRGWNVVSGDASQSVPRVDGGALVLPHTHHARRRSTTLLQCRLTSRNGAAM